MPCRVSPGRTAYTRGSRVGTGSAMQSFAWTARSSGSSGFAARMSWTLTPHTLAIFARVSPVWTTCIVILACLLTSLHTRMASYSFCSFCRALQYLFQYCSVPSAFQLLGPTEGRWPGVS